MKSRKYQESLALIEKDKSYTYAEAIALAKKTATTKFDGSLQVSFNLGIDARQADQQLRGTISLPNGNGKSKRILAITSTKEVSSLISTIFDFTILDFFNSFANVHCNCSSFWVRHQSFRT